MFSNFLRAAMIPTVVNSKLSVHGVFWVIKRALLTYRNQPATRLLSDKTTKGMTMRSALLWLIGVPIPLIIILWLITGHA